MKQIVVLDGYVVNPGDVAWDPIQANGNLTVFDRTESSQIVERSHLADYIVVNKCKITKEHLSQLPNLKAICLLATGYNNVDINYARSLGIDVCNAVGYSSPSVGQHVFALILHLTNHVSIHNASVHTGDWAKSEDWCYWKAPLTELYQKTLGIYGYGKIGRQVAQIGLAFGMNVIAVRNSNRPSDNPLIKMVTNDELFELSDFLTLHAPLTDKNYQIINSVVLSKMKSNAILINTGRGGLIKEDDLAEALNNNLIAAAALDVLDQEPPSINHILYGLPNCIITPHIGWVSRKSRERLISAVADNIRVHQAGSPKHIVN